MNTPSHNTTFHYSLLRYRHSLALDEVLNVGVLVLFPALSRVFFLYPDRLTRLRHSYRDVSERTLKAYFQTFKKRADQLSKQPELFAPFVNDLQGFIYREFLPADGSALQFGQLKTSLQYSTDVILICEHLREQYLGFYEPVEEVRRRDDAYLKATYKSKVEQLLRSVEPKRAFKENYFIFPEQAEHTIARSRFDFGWQNHSLHLVKSVSFDLMQEQSIQTKAYSNFAELTLLDAYAQQQNIQFDVLVATPRERALFDHYERAVDLLRRPKSVKIILEEGLEQYAQQTVAALAEPE